MTDDSRNVLILSLLYFTILTSQQSFLSLDEFYWSTDGNSSYQHEFWETDEKQIIYEKQIIPLTVEGISRYHKLFLHADSSERYNRFLIIHQWAKIWADWNYRL